MLLNLGLLVLAGLIFLTVDVLPEDELPAAAEEEAMATIYLEAPEPETAPKPEVPKRFTRTASGQEAEPDRPTERIGERSTRATSDRAADPNAAPLPSQDGIQPRDEQDIETTESDYQDGALANPAEVPPVPSDMPPPEPLPLEGRSGAPTEAAVTTPPVESGQEARQQLPPPREKLLDGPNPVDVQVPAETAAEEVAERQPQVEPAVADMPPEPEAADPVAPTPTETKSFSGYQRKTAVIGSISRTGRSALDVDDTELGRYQAQISRAVEQEWQRNCVRHRDFITPGFLTVRFFVEVSGKVRSVQFVGDMQTGEVQKGFTLNAIRDAEIPEMPESLGDAFENDPLELIFRFYF